ncbi:MAG: HRDC domain-containing protein [Acidimicrobiia bacterium]|nr:HRDC domain-containing protein [Acidimicrobiia bacterium]
MPELVDTATGLDDVIAAVSAADRYAIDTEFHRERTYFPQVALIQIAWEDQVALIDPLPLDLKPLATVLDGPGLCILHAGVQDLEVLDLATGTIPNRLFDTQIAAGFLGLANGSLKSLLERYLNVPLPKGDRLTDWLRRPLTDEQLRYAAADVDHLLELTEALEEQLIAEGRLVWALEESNLLRERPRNRRLPEEAILRIKEARSLKGSSFRIATAVAAWRERRAAEADIPVRQVLSDLGVVAIAQRAPRGHEQLSGLRGVEHRHLRNGADQEILTAVKVGQRMTSDQVRPQRSPELPRHLRPVVTLVTAWISQLARDHRLDPALLATRADVEALLKDDPEGRLRHGWRSELAGAPIASLVAGNAAVAFDGDGQLVLEARSRRPL